MVNKLIDDIKPFIVMEVLEKASEMEKQGINVIHFEVGEPDFDLPEAVKIASTTAIQNGHTHYTHSLGDRRLRDRIADFYNRTYGVHTHTGNIIVTSGSSPAILLVLSALIEPGDEVIISNPGYRRLLYFRRQPPPFFTLVRLGVRYSGKGACRRDSRNRFRIEEYLRFTAHKDEIVYWGEEGAIGTPPRLQLIRSDILKTGTHRGWETETYLKWYDAYDSFLKTTGFGKDFSPECNTARPRTHRALRPRHAFVHEGDEEQRQRSRQ
jgi:hypothetical protein